MSHYTGAVLKELDRAFNQGTISGLTEGHLLERFVTGRDEAAFGALVARYGPMVLGVCRRLLRDESDVEDAFQATFLVLVRRAGAIRRGDLVGHWLYGVAHRVAVRARALAAGAGRTSRPGCRPARSMPKSTANPVETSSCARSSTKSWPGFRLHCVRRSSSATSRADARQGCPTTAMAGGHGPQQDGAST